MSAYIVDTTCFYSNFPIMGWKWTIQDPTPIHFYHKYMWKTQYKKHFYKICHGFILPIHQAIFNRPAPRLSEEANIDLTSISSWFGEELFTYIRVFGNITDPHVLPLYVPDKLLAREIAYQTLEKGLTKNLKDANKHLWLSFPVRCGIYSLHEYKHAQLEAEKTKGLNLVVIPKRQYDPNVRKLYIIEQWNT